jgi:hypothetical protein
MLRAPAFALASVLLACGGDKEPPKGKDQPAAETPAAKDKKVGATCQPTSALPEGEHDAIVESAVAAAHQLRNGELEALWEAIHPKARADIEQEAFTAALTSMQRRLNTVEELEVVSTAAIDIRGGASALTRVRCELEGDPNPFTLITNAGGEDVAVVQFYSKGRPFGYATTVQLRRHDNVWKILGVHVGLAAYRGKTATDYEGLADAYVSQQRVVEAYLVLAVAEQLANRGGSLKLDQALALADKVEEVGTSKAFQQGLGVWEVGGRRYDIQGFAVTATQSDLSVVLRYVTPTGLIQEALDEEADALLGHLQMQHPEIAKRFDAVVFEAYDSEGAAAEPGSEVQAFRTPRVFPKPEAPDTPSFPQN